MTSQLELLLRKYETNKIDPFVPYAIAIEYDKEGNLDEALHYFGVVYRDYRPYLPNFFHYARCLGQSGHATKARDIIDEGIWCAKEKQDLKAASELQALRDELSGEDTPDQTTDDS